MEYRPKKLEGNVNVSKIHPLKEIAILFFGVLSVFLLIYIILGLLIDYSVQLAPVKIEKALAEFTNRKYIAYEDEKNTGKIVEIVNSLKANVDEGQNHYKNIEVRIGGSGLPNAFALPGGLIVVNKGLLDSVEYEDELYFVLAHEMGHFAARDNLKGIGRGVVFVGFSIALLGSDSSVTDFILNSLENVELTFSREQEMNADLYALNLMNKTFGNTNGAICFMEHLAKEKNTLPLLRNYFSTHPASWKRLEKIKAMINKRQYPVKEMMKIVKE